LPLLIDLLLHCGVAKKNVQNNQRLQRKTEMLLCSFKFLQGSGTKATQLLILPILKEPNNLKNGVWILF
jgi:hypothetical protein